jgi:uncharacterized protein YciI
MRFAYGYVMADKPERVREIAPVHVAYWGAASLDHYLGGPFGDRTGGLITFDVKSQKLAEQLASGDPFRRAGLLKSHWLKEWAAE